MKILKLILLKQVSLGIGKFSLKFNPNVNNQVDYEVLGRVTNESQDQNYLSSSVIGSIEQLDEAETFSINQNLNYYYTLNEKNIFASRGSTFN